MILTLLLACSSDPTPAPSAPTTPTSEAAAPPPAASAGHAHPDGDAHHPPHGGVVQTVADHHLELSFTPGGLMIWISDKDQKPLDPAPFAGMAVVNGPAGVVTVKLDPMGEHLHAVTTLELGKPASAVVTLPIAGQARSLRFEVKAVGMSEHDHTSLHGGVVSMWKDVHVEHTAAGGEHRFYVSDSKRVPIISGVSGSVRDGEKVVPLSFDPATGCLSGKVEGAGTRGVMLEAVVGEETFSLAFNPIGG